MATLQLETLELENEFQSILNLPIAKKWLFLVTAVGILSGKSVASRLQQLEYTGSLRNKIMYVTAFGLVKSMNIPTRISSLIQVGNFLNFISFLFNGKYFDLWSRIFNVRLETSNKNIARFVSFDYMNRRLFWDQFIEFYQFVSNLQRMKPKPNGCGYCGEQASIPFQTNCNHVFCYYCVQSRMGKCIKCGTIISEIRPFIA